MGFRVAKSLFLVYNKPCGFVFSHRGERTVRNRGYKYMINSGSHGYLLLCVNATWINLMLKEKGIVPRDFRALSYQDIASAIPSDYTRALFMTLKPKNFWQMCDVLALSMATYDEKDIRKIYRSKWFVKYPLFTKEDVFEHLMEADFQQEDAIRVMEFVRRGKCKTLKLGRREFLELYNVPEALEEAILHCRTLPSRKEIIDVMIEIIGAALAVKESLE